ncbi:hypothetical protein [Thiobacillus sp. 65-1402]|uniref:hypothetical protein n=1 Tax=Thiobacillus sp. 65-1402 TaxID=1895861 RepID=UPI00092B2E2C|nr:hypothetical protein [Thiobacillus sp. 65-1402]OJW53864.1 MAG: hypothetical protein BGO60_14445 [Thiobacillus sp. 65-1059]OJW85832.1 MAG: hypothetical protein BGO62_09175 [Thiobacillus sp. 65-1402]OZA24949.1 MAG: hypothetical protein B7X91_12120 [Hydrogenophilales bacterium 17-64-11]
MPADQAAGLRRRSARQPLRCIQCFFDSAQSTSRLALALHQRGWTALLVDARGRLLADAPARSLFGWRQQLERGQLHTLPLSHGDGWHAPGARADDPALAGIAQGYDAVVFDAGRDGLALMPGAVHAVVIEVNAAHESMLRAYALLKTLSRADGVGSIGLLGAAAACDRVCAACSHFLDRRFAQAIYSAAHEDGLFAALAVRMACEEASLAAR